MAKYRREVFDRDRNFVTTRPLPVSGRSFGPNEPFDKTLVTTRRLRQLYDQRAIAYPVEETVVSEPVVVKKRIERYRPKSIPELT